MLLFDTLWGAKYISELPTQSEPEIYFPTVGLIFISKFQPCPR